MEISTRAKDKKKARHEKRLLKNELRAFCKAMKSMRKARSFRAKRLALTQGENIEKYPLKDSFLFRSLYEFSSFSDEDQDLF